MGTGIWNPTGVSFSSGGARIVGHFGVLTQLLESGTFDHVRDWYGCSAGAFSALVGALGCSASWIRDLVGHLDLSSFAAVEEEVVINFLEQFGVSSGDKAIQLMKRFMDTWEPGISTWTFRDLAAKRPGINLTIIATNLTEGRLKVFNAQNTPDTPLFDAIRASCTIPFYYIPWRDTNGDLLCDGAALEVYPWTPVTDKAHTLVVVCTDDDISGRPEKKRQIVSVGDYLSCLLDLMTKNKSSVHPRHWIAVNNRDVGFMDFYISPKDRLRLFEEGVNAAKGWDRFRLQVLSAETRETHPPFEGPHTLSSWHPSQNRTLDSPPAHSPARTACLSPDSHSEGPPPARRWSL